jgi:hypothetical protein
MTPEPGQDIPKTVGSARRVWFVCACGRRHEARWSHVAKGLINTCGRCRFDSVPDTKYGRLRLKPGQGELKTANKYVWLCDCGREKSITLNSVLLGHSRSCTMCNLIRLKRGEKIGNFLYDGDEMDVLPNSGTKIDVLCVCGKKKNLSLNKISSGMKTCGGCHVRPASWWAGREFGRLTIDSPADLFEGSEKKALWRCKCGSKKYIRTSHVTSGATNSCGDCRRSVQKWVDDNILFLSSPGRKKVSDFPGGGITPLEDVKNATVPFSALCPVCGSPYRPRLSDIKRGLSLTCGCATHLISSQNHEVYEFLSKIVENAQMEFVVAGSKFDIAIPSKKLIIEMQGLRYHCGLEAKTRDSRKRKIAIEGGYRPISIFEDEWKKKRVAIEGILSSAVGRFHGVSIRPSKCQTGAVLAEEADEFYGRFHYIGVCRPSVTLAARVDGRLVACMSFSRPTRQSSHPWELVRMASDPAFHVHGIWSKLFGMFVREHSPSSVVSFSDNRLFTGAVYGKLGFSMDGEVRPDYYWVRNNVRYHKSGLRKRGAERTSGLTETQLREAQGYQKIWDYGKKRWVWRPPGLITSARAAARQAAPG